MSHFEQKKRSLIEENEKRYGGEIRTAYGDKTVNTGNAQLMNMSEEDFNRMQSVGEQILLELEKAVSAGLPPDGKEGRHIAELHRQWLGAYLPYLTREIHTGIAEMYVADQRFTATYDIRTPGCAAFLREAINLYWEAQ